MSKTPEKLSSHLSCLADEMRELEQRLGSEPPPESGVLNDFRQVVDNIRLKAWTVSELINARCSREDPDAFLAFLTAERLRRLDQMVKTLCSDIQRGAVTLETSGMHALLDSLETLRHTAESPKHQHHAKEAAG